MSFSPFWSVCEAIFGSLCAASMAVSSAKVPIVKDSDVGKSAVNSK